MRSGRSNRFFSGAWRADYHGAMEIIFNVLRRLFKLALVIWVGMLALSILLAVLTAVAANVLWSLLRGRKPALFTTYTRFRQASQQFLSLIHI